jgi:phosphate transport system permease protein
MVERHRDAQEYFVAAGAPDGGDGTLDRPFGSLAEALAAVQSKSEMLFARPSGDGQRALEIIVIAAPGRTLRAGRRADHEFFVDTRPSGEGDGSELTPWPGLRTAAAELLQRHADGRLALQPGQRLRVTQREVFAATAFERGKKLKETFAKYVFLSMTLLLVTPVVLILAYLVIKAWPALSADFLFTNPQNRMTAGGIWAPLIGTFSLVLISLLIAAPIGVLAGVYLNEYAGDNWATRIINLAVVNLAGVPSIVHALFGVGAFVLFFNMGRSLAAASCTVAVMTLPVIITSSREALAAVPMAFREACWNMGATRWQTIRKVVLPNAISGILTGVILEVSRTAGETAPIMFTGAAFFLPMLPQSMFDQTMALSLHLFVVSTQVPGVPEHLPFGVALVLIALVLIMNSVSIAFRVYLRGRKKW